MIRKLKKLINFVLPYYALLPIVACFVVNSLVYYGVRLIDDNFVHRDYTMAFDRMVPFIPAFVSIYFICYLFWIINYILIGRLDKEHLYRFATAELISRVVCLIFFILIPTTNVRPEVVGDGIWNDAMRTLYQIDEANNLFPSIHCLVSWFSYIGIRGRKEIPKWYRGFSMIFALLVCASTQFIKQHYIIDLIGGVLLAEATYYVAQKTNIYLAFQKVFDKLNYFIWGKEEEKEQRVIGHGKQEKANI